MSDSQAALRWRRGLEAWWHIPPDIRAVARVDPGTQPAWLYEHRLAQVRGIDTPSNRRALEALPDGGSILDVGAGVGAASLPLAGRCGSVVAVDERTEMLHAFAGRAKESGVEHILIEGTWPDVAGQVPDVDVAVCHNVLFNIADLGSFLDALRRVGRRVVLEASVAHPFSYLREPWYRLHGVRRPAGPTADDAVTVLVEDLGIPAVVDRWERPSFWAGVPDEKIIEVVRIRLCASSTRDEEIRRSLDFDALRAPQPALTIRWDQG